jgi:subtilisin-like proprotein convertase family protein
MEDTYWIDGIYNGGKFASGYGASLYIIGLMPVDGCKVGNVVLTFQNNPFINYKFLPGEYINLTFNDEDYEYSNYYNGVFLVLKVDNDLGVTKIEIDLLYITGTSISPDTTKLSIIGNLEKYSATGLIQNFNFYDSNRSKIKSGNNSLSSSIFRFNSWMDVNYDETRAVTIGKVFKSYDLLTKKSISRNNLYGYPTYDVLSSNSYFRDSFSLDVNSYILGTKYKLFNDFIGDYSSFNEPFDNLDETGWTYSYNKPSDIELLRTDSIVSLNVYDLETTQAYLDSGVTGDELYALGASAGVILNNNNITMDKDRYSVIEFDVITHSNYNTDYIHRNSDYYTIESIPATNGTFSKYPIPNQVTSEYYIQNLYPNDSGYISSDIILADIVEIEVGVDLIGDLSKITINLVSPNGSVINLKKYGTGIGFRLVGTKFNTNDSYQTVGDSISPYSMLGVQPPPYSGLYGMDKVIGQGTMSFTSNTYFWEDLISTITGNWTLYVADDTSTVDLESWSLKFFYKNIIAKNNRPDISLPILHLSNLNYDISNQIVGTATEQVYNKMSYLPISENIDHIVTENSFRLDVSQNTSPENSSEYQNIANKKYEYFYNKTDLMMSISGNGFMGSSSSMVILDNIKLYEVDMIPFFKYFTEDNIYKGIQNPITATAPSIDYSKSDFIFLDNINIGIDTVETTIIVNDIKCDIPNNVIIAPTNLSYTTPNTLAIGSSISLNPLFLGTIGVFSSNITLPPGILLSPTTGIISGIGVSVSTGDYIITMENEAGSVSFTVKITITVAPVLPNKLIIANNDNYPVFNNVANYTNSVITGDKLDGAQVTIGIGTNGVSLQQLSTTNIAINIDALGRINVPIGISPGSYTIQYKICETNNPTNCSSAFALVSVSSVILPLLSFYYKGIWNAGDTLNKPEINSWVDYFDANGLVNRFIIGPVENGCQLISASSIKTVTNCVTCTISTITYPFCDGTTYVTGPGQTGRQYDDFRCGGNSCVLKGTEITMFDGSIKKVEDIVLGDKLFSKSVGGLNENEDNNETWRSELLTLIDCEVEVVKIIPINVSSVNNINDGLLNVSDSHIHLVKQNGEWRLLRTFELKIGDFLTDEFGNEIEIYKIEILSGELTIYDLGVEDNDLYIANGILTHK